MVLGDPDQPACATSVRVSILSNPFTRTSRKNPTSARCAKPSASFASVLFGAPYRAQLWRGEHRCRSLAAFRT